MQYDKVYEFITGQLEHGLPHYLSYHHLQHTKNVIAAVELLSAGEKITGEDLLLLRTAALFHDTGFLQHHDNHEELSCKLARKYLPDYGFSDGNIEQICRMIMTTKLPQSANEPLSQILCDADLYYLGAENYPAVADNLFKEYQKTGKVQNREEWDLMQFEFLKAHKYFTKTAKETREEGKQKNLEAIRQRIESTTAQSEKKNAVGYITDFLTMLVGVVFAGVALKGFLVPNHFFDGGITGMSLLVHEIYHYNLAIVIVLLNLPLVAMSYFTVGKHFAFRALLAVVMLGICLVLLPDFALTSDKLLISIFGGVILGIGVGLVMRTGAALDGIEVLAIYTLKRTSFTITEIILGINIIIFSIAALHFGIETALYSILTYFMATRSIDFVVEGLEAFTGVTIISTKSEVIKYRLVNEMGKGITVYKGERGFLPGKFDMHDECDIIFTVITRMELRKLKNLVYHADPKAFVFANTIKEASGGILKRLQHH